MNAVHVVDISHWQDTPDFVTAKAKGLVGVFHKATEGSTYVDQNFTARREAARAAGLPFASYHFLHGGDITGQIAHYLSIVNPAKGERVVIDHEAEATLAELRQAVQLLLDDSRNLQVTVYSGHLIKDQLGNTNDPTLAKAALWIAQYTDAAAPSWPKATWPVWSLWQFSDDGFVPGFAEPVDVNTFNGTREACARWFGPATATPQPSPQPQPQPDANVVTITINAPPGISVNVVKVNP